jgi:hypothetical protein
MEHNGKQYSVVHIDGSWRWSVDLKGRIRSGKSPIRVTAIKKVEREIDRVLAQKKVRLGPRER